MSKSPRLGDQRRFSWTGIWPPNGIVMQANLVARQSPVVDRHLVQLAGKLSGIVVFFLRRLTGRSADEHATVASRRTEVLPLADQCSIDVEKHLGTLLHGRDVM